MRQIAFITGASSGIGRALTMGLASKGYALALAARRRELLDDLCDKVRQLGGEAIPLACDVSDQMQVKQAVAETIQNYGKIDLAILSAGIGGTTDAAEFKADKLRQLVQTNLFGVAYCLEELLPIMQQQKEGTIAAISSLAGDRGIPGSAGYCASKAALSTLFDGLRAELKAHRINLVTIEPGYVLTPMTESFGRMPFLMQADEAARLILRRIERGDRVIRFPFFPSVFMKLMRMLPVSLFDIFVARRRPVKLKAN